jgi:hypothetical protein
MNALLKRKKLFVKAKKDKMEKFIEKNNLPEIPEWNKDIP